MSEKVKKLVDSLLDHPMRGANYFSDQYDNTTATSEDVLQEYCRIVVEALIEYDIPHDRDSCRVDEHGRRRWKFFEDLPDYLDAIACASKKAKNGDDLSFLFMQDAMKVVKKSLDKTRGRKERQGELSSWDLEVLEKLILDVDHLYGASTSRQFDTFAEIEGALESNMDEQYDLSDAAQMVLDMFRNGTTHQRRAISLMLQVAGHRERGEKIPPALSNKIARVRPQVEEFGWVLDVKFLK